MANKTLTVDLLRENIKRLIDSRISYFIPTLNISTSGDETYYDTNIKVATYEDINNNGKLDIDDLEVWDNETYSDK